MTPCRATSAGLVIVDAWTLATTRRLSPTFTRPRSLSLLGYGSGHGMSEPCLDGLVAGAALLDGGDGAAMAQSSNIWCSGLKIAI